MGAITLTLADGASAAFGAAHIDDGSGGYGATLISGNSAADIVIGAVSASSIGTTTISLGTASTATFGIRDANTQGAISVTLASGASAEFGTIRGGTAGGSVGDITVTIGSAAGMNFGIIGDGSGSIGAINITLREGGSADFGDLNATASRISDITLNVTGGASVQFDDVAASAMGTIIVSGSGAIAFGTASATTLGGIDLRNQGSGGTFSIDLSGVTNGVVVDGGRGTTTIKSGVGNDDFYLKTGLGTDSIVFTGSGQGVDTVYRFEAGTADDKISIKGSGGIVISDGSGDVLATTLGTAANVTFLSATAAGTTLLTADANLVVITHTAYASVTAMVSSIASGGDHLIGLVAGASSDAAGNLAVVWTDGTDSYVTLVSIGADNTAIDDDSYSADTLVTLNGVTAGALVAANFSFVS